jgi:carboxylesterase type B
MVWVHGGGYTTGASNKYHPAGIVHGSQGSIVLVTLNYRLNVFGFLASKEINESSANGAGNFGIQDQRLAMRWVQDHIAAFGGDSSKVTIFGQSAGGNSVMNHLAQEASRGLYSKAVIESGAYNTGAYTFKEQQLKYDALLEATSGCNSSKIGRAGLECLLSLEAKHLVSDGVLEKLPAGWAPTIDGT